MHLWRPQIWTPFGDRCPDCNRRRRRRRFNPLRFAAGDRLLDASGNVMLDASGNVMLSNGAGDDCCCETANPCTACEDVTPGSTPLEWTITLTGITLCPCAGGVLPVGDPNGTFTLAQNPAIPCAWNVLIPTSTVRLDVFSDAPCTTKIREDPFGLGITLTATNLAISYSASTGGWGLGGPPVIFRKSVTAFVDCESAYTGLANDPRACGSGNPIQAGTGGTATLTPS